MNETMKRMIELFDENLSLKKQVRELAVELERARNERNHAHVDAQRAVNRLHVQPQWEGMEGCCKCDTCTAKRLAEYHEDRTWSPGK